MPYVVYWTENASLGLEKVYHFLAEKSEDAAKAALMAIREKALLLEQFPNAGRPADDFEPEYRELLIPFGGAGYVLVYEVMGTSVYVLAIKHQREVGY
ncbi:type II toxin-antitoxin system RelE/ParE family toxin [Desulfovibrio sp. OttesenSCG-928-G15]|nr:type II toxin-antitoxin system RelE/ParE family toxin [Desulfovibrio sp. OttesenSCG-928-G15]